MAIKECGGAGQGTCDASDLTWVNKPGHGGDGDAVITAAEASKANTAMAEDVKSPSGEVHGAAPKPATPPKPSTPPATHGNKGTSKGTSTSTPSPALPDTHSIPDAIPTPSKAAVVKPDHFEREARSYLEGEGGDGFVKKDATLSGLIGATTGAAAEDLRAEHATDKKTSESDGTTTVGALAELAKNRASTTTAPHVDVQNLPKTATSWPVRILDGKANLDQSYNVTFNPSKGTINSNDIERMAMGAIAGYTNMPGSQKEVIRQRLSELAGTPEEQVQYLAHYALQPEYEPAFSNEPNSDISYLQSKLDESSLEDEEKREILKNYKEARADLSTREQRWNVVTSSDNAEDLADALENSTGKAANPQTVLSRVESHLIDETDKAAVRELRGQPDAARKALADLLETNPAVAEYATAKASVPFLEVEQEKAQTELDQVQDWNRYVAKNPDAVNMTDAKKAADDAIDAALKDTTAQKERDAANTAVSAKQTTTGTALGKLNGAVRNNKDQNKQYLDGIAQEFRAAKSKEKQDEILKRFKEEFVNTLKSNALKTSAQAFYDNLAAEGPDLLAQAEKQQAYDKAKDSEWKKMSKAIGSSNPVKTYQNALDDKSRPGVELPEDLRQQSGESVADWRKRLEAKKTELEEDIDQYNHLSAEAKARMAKTPADVQKKYDDTMSAIAKADKNLADAASAYDDGRLADMTSALRQGAPGYKGTITRDSFDEKGKKHVDDGRTALRKSHTDTLEYADTLAAFPGKIMKDAGEIITGAKTITDGAIGLADAISGASSEEFKRITQSIDKAADAMFTKAVGTERRDKLLDGLTKLKDLLKAPESKAVSAEEALSKRVNADGQLTHKGRAENRVASNNYRTQGLTNRESDSKADAADLENQIKQARYNKMLPERPRFS